MAVANFGKSLWATIPTGVLLLILAVSCVLVGEAADHRDGPIFGPPGTTAANGRPDINDVYIFQAPGNINDTVMAMTVSPFAGVLTPVTFDSTVTYELNVGKTPTTFQDMKFDMNLSAPDVNGVQNVALRVSQVGETGSIVIAQGKTGQNLRVAGGGMFRADVFDDPFFFDGPAFAAVISGQTPPPAPGGFRNPGVNSFGPTVNTLGFVLEVPTFRVRNAANNPNISVWARTSRNGTQLDRTGRPAINTALIPPVPRSDLSRGDRRNAFNAGNPANDVQNFNADMMAVLTNPNGVYKRTAADATGLANFLLPDVLTFDTNTAFTTNSTDANGFPNGRRLRDAVINFELKLLLNNPAATDNTSDDNGDRITDGTARPDGTFRPIAFPYMGPPNNPPGNPAGFH